MKRTPLCRPIPPEQRERMSQDPFYKKCCVGNHVCRGRIQWHHNFTYQGKRTDDEWGILPVCEYVHEKVAQFKKMLDAVMFTRKSREEIKKQYPKSTI